MFSSLNLINYHDLLWGGHWIRFSCKQTSLILQHFSFLISLHLLLPKTLAEQHILLTEGGEPHPVGQMLVLKHPEDVMHGDRLATFLLVDIVLQMFIGNFM